MAISSSSSFSHRQDRVSPVFLWNIYSIKAYMRIFLRLQVQKNDWIILFANLLVKTVSDLKSEVAIILISRFAIALIFSVDGVCSSSFFNSEACKSILLDS